MHQASPRIEGLISFLQSFLGIHPSYHETRSMELFETRNMVFSRGFETHQTSAALPVAILVESLLYGVQLVLFCICAYILIKRRRPSQLVLLLAVTIMFSLATVDLAISFRMIVDDLPTVADPDSRAALTHLYPKNPLYVTNNFLADALLLYRCYMIWGGQRYVIIGSAALLVADTVWGYVTVGTAMFSLQNTFNSLFLWSVFVYNLIMTAATAGRIWWMARAGRHLLGKQSLKRYYAAVAILIESGAVYCISLLTMLLMPDKPYRLIVQVVVIRLVAIMPILMIVQVELGGNSKEFGKDLQLSNHSRNPRTYSVTDNLPTAKSFAEIQEQSSPKLHWDLSNTQVPYQPPQTPSRP